MSLFLPNRNVSEVYLDLKGATWGLIPAQLARVAAQGSDNIQILQLNRSADLGKMPSKSG
jgi:hypothetical protein